MRRRPDQRLELLTLVNASTNFFLPGAAPPADDDTHCCLHCTFRGLRSPNAREIQRHHIAAGHFLAVGLARGLLWCAKCGDYVYDELFEEAWRLRAADASADGEMRCLPILDDSALDGDTDIYSMVDTPKEISEGSKPSSTGTRLVADEEGKGLIVSKGVESAMTIATDPPLIAPQVRAPMVSATTTSLQGKEMKKRATPPPDVDGGGHSTASDAGRCKAQKVERGNPTRPPPPSKQKSDDFFATTSSSCSSSLPFSPSSPSLEEPLVVVPLQSPPPLPESFSPPIEPVPVLQGRAPLKAATVSSPSKPTSSASGATASTTVEEIATTADGTAAVALAEDTTPPDETETEMETDAAAARPHGASSDDTQLGGTPDVSGARGHELNASGSSGGETDDCCPAVELMDAPTRALLGARHGLRGLYNMGNTCFMNCILASLAHISLVQGTILAAPAAAMDVTALASSNGPALAGSPVTSQKGRTLAQEFGSFMRRMFGENAHLLRQQRAVGDGGGATAAATAPNGVVDLTAAAAGGGGGGVGGSGRRGSAGNPSCMPLAPHEVLFATWSHVQHMAGYAQQDAHEFLVALLDGLEAAPIAIDTAAIAATSTTRVDLDGDNDIDSSSSGESHASSTSLASSDSNGSVSKIEACSPLPPARRQFVQQIFGGMLCSTVTCDVCDRKSRKFESFLDLSLPLARHKPQPSSSSSATNSPTKDAETEKKDTPKPTCPKKHVLRGPSSTRPLAYCDACQGPVGNRAFSCRGCNYDLCATCYGPYTPKSAGRPKGSGADYSGRGLLGPVRLNTTIQECLAQFTAAEKLAAAYFCEGCKTKQNATKELRLVRLPPVLIIHLKRFDAVYKSKLGHSVHFPISGIDLAPHLMKMPPPESEPANAKKKNGHGSGRAKGSTSVGGDVAELEPCYYDVVACVNHTGTLSKGHYTAQFREGGLWFNADDMYIEHLTEEAAQENANSGEPYIIFLEKRKSTTSRTRSKQQRDNEKEEKVSNRA